MEELRKVVSCSAIMDSFSSIGVASIWLTPAKFGGILPKEVSGGQEKAEVYAGV
jgi:hypothetical protein